MLDILLSSLVAGLLFGSVLALVALGLTIIFGVMDIVNFAHGEFLMLGMYTGLISAEATGLDPVLMLPVAAFVGFVLGVVCYSGFIRFLLRGPMIAQLLGTFGLMLLLRNLALLIFGPEDRAVMSGVLVGRSFDLGMGVIIPATKLAAAGFSVLAFVGVWLLINRTRLGKALKATSLNAQGARYMGIPTEKMNALAWGIGGGSVMVAGAILVNFWSVTPFTGLLFTMMAFAIVALGGFGSVPGAFFAGLVVGLITELPGFWDFVTYTFEVEWMYDVPMTSFKYMWVYLAYSGLAVLQGVSLQVNEGETVAIVGSNGAGKSTLLRAVMGTQPVFEGAIRFQGEAIHNLRTEAIVRKGIVYVPEEKMLFSPLTVEENILMGGYILSDESRIQHNLEVMYELFPQLHERRQQAAATLSGGEQQMLAIGRGLMSDPKVLMLDEPSLGLAPKLVDEVLDTVGRLKQQGMTIVLVEQNVREALDLADRAYVLQTGRIVAEGTGAELQQSDLFRSAFLGI